MKRVFARLFHKKDFQQAACVQSTSPQETEELCCWVPRQRIRQIPNGVNVESIDSAEAARLFRKKFPLLRGRKVVLFLGRITPKKRPEMLVEAVAQLRSEFPDLTLVLAGCDDGHTAAVRTAVARFGLEDSVLEAGFLQGELKQGVFAVADLFALPSIDENFGIAVIEAMAHAVPVLLTSGVAAHVYVSQSGGGATVDGTAEAFADGMRKLLKSDLKEMGRKGQAFVKQNLSWCAVNRQLERLYRQILA